MESIQTSACLLLKLNDQEMKKLCVDKNIISKLLLTIGDQYDVQQIKNTLKIVDRLIKQGSQLPNDYYQMIQNIRLQWEQGRTRQIGNRTIRFGRSQQIVNCCDTCLHSLLCV